MVIGAGSAGLAAAAALQREGVQAILLERGDGVATSWRMRHQELRLNTIRWLSDLPGLPMPRRLGRWVTRDSYITYLELFAQHHRLDIRHNVNVHRIDAGAGAGAGGWDVTTSTGTLHTDHVIVASGHDAVPWLPDWPGSAGHTRPIQHVAHHRRAADLAGLRVLLVGAGNSGIEIAGHLLDAGVADLWVSVRSTPNILPRQVAGIPLHSLTVAMRALPERLRDIAAQAIARYAFGDLTPYGLPTPRTGPFERMRTTGVTVAVDQGFVAHLKAGHLRIVPEIDHLTDTDVVLRDGRRLQPDILLAATGYRTGLDDLVGHLNVLDTAGRPHRSVDALPRGLWFVGFHTAIEGNLRRHPIEARRLARIIARSRVLDTTRPEVPL
jgi:cation diffusion facilitator CzcD-associated flavoprotein CzcO